MKKFLLYSFFITAMLCIVGINNAWADVTYTLSSGTLTFSYSGSGSSAMSDYVNADTGTPKRPITWPTQVTNVVINEGVTTIGSFVFQGCANITSIHIPTSVTLCKEGAFIGCTGLANIYYAGTPNQWANIDFTITNNECNSHPFFASTASSRSFYFYGKNTETTELALRTGITTIKPYAFYKANRFGYTYIPGTVTSIGAHALDCPLTRIHINKSVAPTTGTTALSWNTSSTYLYLRADATDSYNKTPWYDITPGTSTGAKTLGYNDAADTRISCPWKTGRYLHIVSGTIGTISWTLDTVGTLTFSGYGNIAATYDNTNAGNGKVVLPWFRFKQLINKVVIQADGGDITGLSNALQYCYAIDEITIKQTTIPTMTFNTNSSFRKSSDKIKVYVDYSSEGAANLSVSPWNGSNLDIEYTSTFCSDPADLTINSIGTTTATASWTDDRGDSWKYICKTAASAAPTSSEWESASTTTSKSVNLTSLTQGTKYKFYLISDCGSVGTSEVISENFSTDCGTISTLPWNYGFENCTNDETPLCWKQLRTGGGSIGYVQAKTSVSYKKSGSLGMAIYGGNSSNVVTAIFPEFDEEISNLELTFYYKADVTSEWSTYGQPQLGYVTNPNSAASFVAFGDPLAQRSIFGKVGGINMSSAPAGARFAIRYSGGSDVGYVSIDDITVTEKRSCSKPTSVAVTADSETDEGATITWNANSMSAWQIQVSEGDAASWGESMDVATNSKVLTGLNAHTLYYVRVRANCGTGEENKSEWSDNVSFTTLCGTINVNSTTSWNNDFESLGDHVIPECWDNTASTTTSSWGSGYIWGTFERNSNKSLAMNNSVCDGGTALINTPSIAIPDDGRTYELSFDYANMALAGNNLLVKISVNGGAFADKGTYYPSGNVSSYPDEFVPATISLAEYSGQTIKVQFFANPTSGTSSEGGAMFIDNVSVHKVPTCFPPTALSAGNLTDNSAHITWTAGASESAWRLQYRTDGGSWSAEQAVSTTPAFDIESLSANTEYFVRVKAYCGVEDQSEWSEVASFTTLCAAESMPFSESFSSASALPSCWEATPASGTYKWAAYENSGAYSVQLRTGSSGSAELRMPPVALSEDAILRFEWKNANGAQVNIYISTDGGSSRTMIPTDLSGIHADWTTKIFDLSAYTGQTAIIYFVANFSTANQYAYLDDVEVVARPCDMILNISASPITGGGTLSWSGSVKKIRYKTGANEWSYATPANNAGPHTLSGLTPATSYQFCLLPACSAEEEANWTSPVFFTTKATELIPYSNDFEAETPGEVPFNWSRISASEYPQVSHDSYAYRDGGSFGDQGNSVKFYGVNDQILVFPEFDADLGDLIVSLHHRSRDCKMELGYVEEDGSTFVALETLPTQPGYGEFPFEKDLYGISSDAKNLAIRYSEAGASAQAWVDNVEVKEATCGQPTDLAYDNVTANSVHISWSASARGGESNYQYIRQVASAADPNWASATLIGNDVTELNITGLNANTKYEFYLRSYCGVSDQSTPVKVEFTTLMKDEVFEDQASAINNETRLAALEGQTINMTIKRPLLLNGDYCTLCLPFNLSASEIANPECPLHGFVIKEFEMSQAASGAVNIYLNQVTSIEAGKAYFVRYAGEPSEDRLTPMTFRSVEIIRSTPLDEELTDDCTPHGVFNPYALVANDATTLFLSSNNTLYYPSANGTMNGFRAYLKVGGELSAPIRRGAPIRIVEKENTATGLDQITNDKSPMTNKVLRDGQIIIIRDGKEYNIMGIMVK